MTTDPFHPERLSPEGAARRDAMLGQLQQAMRSRRRRRAAAAWSAAGLLLAASATLVALLSSPRPTPSRSDDVARLPVDPAPSSAPRVVTIATDPTVLSRLSVRPDSRARTVVISDDELVALAKASGLGDGLMRVRGQAVLLSDRSGKSDNSPTPDNRSIGQ